MILKKVGRVSKQETGIAFGFDSRLFYFEDFAAHYRDCKSIQLFDV